MFVNILKQQVVSVFIKYNQVLFIYYFYSPTHNYTIKFYSKKLQNIV